jgi:hypothetical protein
VAKTCRRHQCSSNSRSMRTPPTHHQS